MHYKHGVSTGAQLITQHVLGVHMHMCVYVCVCVCTKKFEV